MSRSGCAGTQRQAPAARRSAQASASARAASIAPWRAMIAIASARSPSRWSPFSITRTQKARSSASAFATALITGSVSLRSRKSSPVFLPIAAALPP